jgi:hypothetical protein
MEPDRIDPARVVVSAVFECKGGYDTETIMLYRTLDANGGALAEARRRAYCAGPLDPAVAATLDGLGVEVIETESIIDEYPHANKIRMFERRAADEDVVIALDTDVCIAGDFSSWLFPGVAAAKPVDQNPLTMEQWYRLFDYFGVPLPTARHRTHFHGDLVVPYFNTGVVVFPLDDRVAEFTERWERYVRDLWPNYDRVGMEIGQKRFFTDQYAFAITLADLAVPILALPLTMNFATHHEMHESFEPDSIEPLLVHHHHRIEEDALLPTGYAGPDAAIARINRALAMTRPADGQGAARVWASPD